MSKALDLRKTCDQTTLLTEISNRAGGLIMNDFKPNAFVHHNASPCDLVYIHLTPTATCTIYGTRDHVPNGDVRRMWYTL